MRKRKLFSIILSVILVFTLVTSAVPPVFADVNDYKMYESESNDTIGTADRIYSDYTVYGSVSGIDVDCYKFNISGNSIVNILTVADYSSLLIGLYNANDEVISLVWYIGLSSTGTAQYSLTTTLSSGTYYLRFLDSEKKYGNDYVLYFLDNPITYPATSISLNKSSLNLIEGESETLTATVLPYNTTDSVSWRSSNSSVATVNSYGKVVAVSEGTATITATAGNYSATCVVTVEPFVCPATDISLNKNTLNLLEGAEETLIATVSPSNTTDSVSWESSDTSVATVDSSGKVTAVSEGVATITATAGKCSTTCVVTIDRLFSSGSGTESDPYIITKKVHLDNVRSHSSSYFRLGANIKFEASDFTQDGNFYNGGAGWQPIGDDTAPFTGSFDGNGYTITGLEISITSSEDVYAGLFGYLSNASICNLGMVGCSITATVSSDSAVSAYAGSIAGYAVEGTVIDNCYNTGSITASSTRDAYASGIVGSGDKTLNIKNCYNTGNISANATSSVTLDSVYASGITASSGTITNCNNAGNVTANGFWSTTAGGIVASTAGSITNCHNTGKIAGYGAISKYVVNVHVGGITGYASGEAAITGCHNTGNVMADGMNNSDAGGIVGYSIGATTITKCYNAGIITANATTTSSTPKAWAGGILGRNNDGNVAITDCYNAGSITATHSTSASEFEAYAGGIAGWLNDSTLDNCYNIGDVTADATDYYTSTRIYAGGILGFDNLRNNISDCYYLDTIAQGIGNRSNVGDGSSPGTTPLSDAQMKDKTNFIGFDFETVWTMGGNPNYPYPELIGVGKVTSIQLSAKPDKLVYSKGESLDLSGGKLTVFYENNTTVVMDMAEAAVTGFDNRAFGKQVLTVTYMGKTTTFEIEVLKTYIIGDLDGDEELTDWDGILLNRYLAGWTVEIDMDACDIDGDGEITDWDGVLLDRYLAGWAVDSEIGK